MTRVQVLDNAPVAPGTCILCGSAGGDGRKFVDFGKQVDWIGAIYFCSECFAQIVRALGWVPVAEFNALLTEHKEIKAKALGVLNQNKRFTDALNIIFVELGRNPDTVDDYIERVLASVPESEKIGEDDNMSATGESEANESDIVEGSDDIFDASDFEQ